MATETDILEVLVTFIKKTEFIDNDLATFLQLVEDLDLVSLDLESLIINPGIYYKTMATKLISGSLKHWLDENQSEESFLDMYHESREM